MYSRRTLRSSKKSSPASAAPRHREIKRVRCSEDLQGFGGGIALTSNVALQMTSNRLLAPAPHLPLFDSPVTELERWEAAPKIHLARRWAPSAE